MHPFPFFFSFPPRIAFTLRSKGEESHLTAVIAFCLPSYSEDYVSEAELPALHLLWRGALAEEIQAAGTVSYHRDASSSRTHAFFSADAGDYSAAVSPLESQQLCLAESGSQSGFQAEGRESGGFVYAES